MGFMVISWQTYSQGLPRGLDASNLTSKYESFFKYPNPFHLMCDTNEIDTNNMKSTWPTQAPMRRDPMRPYSTCSHWGLLWVDWDSRWVDWDSHWVGEAFQIPTCWYRQCESLTLGAVLNVKPQCEWVHVLVDYGLNFQNPSYIHISMPQNETLSSK